jgi:hypothetical protein
MSQAAISGKEIVREKLVRGEAASHSCKAVTPSWPASWLRYKPRIRCDPGLSGWVGSDFSGAPSIHRDSSPSGFLGFSSKVVLSLAQGSVVLNRFAAGLTSLFTSEFCFRFILSGSGTLG